MSNSTKFDGNSTSSSCAKTSYATQAFADEDIARIRSKSKRKIVPNISYHCNKCGMWHISSRSNTTDIKSQMRELIIQNKEFKIVNTTLENQLKWTKDKLEKKTKEHIRQMGEMNKRLNQAYNLNLTKVKFNEMVRTKNATIKLLRKNIRDLIDSNTKLRKNISDLDNSTKTK